MMMQMGFDTLSPYKIHYAYSMGVFPMTMLDGSIGWFRPQERALFPLMGMHVSRSLAKVIRQGLFEIRFDTAFESVMRGCLRPDDNWISEEFIQVYTEIHLQGWGHSIETWREGRLVGGVYGVALGGVFCAESMFHRETNASKVALWAAIERCRELGFSVFDAQVMNPHLASLGAFTVSREKYDRMLSKGLRQSNPWSEKSPYL